MERDKDRHEIHAEVPRSLVGLPDFKSGVGR